MGVPSDADDRDAIRTLLHEYCFRLDAGDLDGVAALFADATMGSPDRPDRLRGTTAVRSNYDGVILYDDGTPCTQHNLANTTIVLDCDTATSTSYFTVLQSRPDFALQPILAGRYVDRFDRVDGRWRFAARVIHPDRIGDMTRHMRADRQPPRR